VGATVGGSLNQEQKKVVVVHGILVVVDGQAELDHAVDAVGKGLQLVELEAFFKRLMGQMGEGIQKGRGQEGPGRFRFARLCIATHKFITQVSYCRGPSPAQIHVRADVADRVVGARCVCVRSYGCATCRQETVFGFGHGSQGVVQRCRSTSDETVRSPRVAVWVVVHVRDDLAKRRLCGNQGLARRNVCRKLVHDVLASCGREAELLTEHHDSRDRSAQQLTGTIDIFRRDTVARRVRRSLGSASGIAKRVEVGAISRVWD
jgi:hypothetical protein